MQVVAWGEVVVVSVFIVVVLLMALAVYLARRTDKPIVRYFLLFIALPLAVLFFISYAIASLLIPKDKVRVREYRRYYYD
ncbi:hypothetical protein [Corynebacterium spheniscorum]|uniref:Uncharacterized protein n=1 Tax=Corynebacterium spheniscorum TaxID=185761 RepID=A0A1I2U6S4_9CORY|nr:hypothetical protein [Corynebacterium spheniscorum]KAA8720743.1 hypothetical protein F4V56_07305 [Corynebacterium spheniscorum]SFG72832.1 hypothetical protein SAMN05660282_01750 [Corynebacterium spheniscorum]